MRGGQGQSAFDVVSLVQNASPPMLVLSLLLLLASVVVWITAVVKYRQLGRWRSVELDLQRAIVRARSAREAGDLLKRHPDSIVGQLLSGIQGGQLDTALLDFDEEYLAALQEQRVFSGLTLLASIASAAPLAGLFGTVFGIMEAFGRIGLERNASLHVVAPAIGDALVTTILGLFAAIPAVVAYNLLSRRGELLLSQSRAFARAWLHRFANAPGG